MMQQQPIISNASLNAHPPASASKTQLATHPHYTQYNNSSPYHSRSNSGTGSGIPHSDAIHIQHNSPQENTPLLPHFEATPHNNSSGRISPTGSVGATPMSQSTSNESVRSSGSGRSGKTAVMRRNPYDAENRWIPIAPSPIHEDGEQQTLSDSARTTPPSVIPCPEPISNDLFEAPVTIAHTELVNKLRFIPYSSFSRPPSSFTFPSPPAQGSRQGPVEQRVFLGQLPYDVTPSLVAAIVHELTGIVFRSSPEIIVSNRGRKPSATQPPPKAPSSPARELVPTGCVHAFCSPNDLDFVLSTLNKRVLVESSGIWFAQDAHAEIVLKEYCKYLRSASAKRFPGLPCDSVSAQVATSTTRGPRRGPSRAH